jgi:hypothetical protein
MQTDKRLNDVLTRLDEKKEKIVFLRVYMMASPAKRVITRLLLCQGV